MQRKRELRCCLGCGRDTYGMFCSRCGGRDPSAGKGRGYSADPARPSRDLPLEDDYSEESGANSVCEDDSASVSRR
jgi:hypothetical protein